MYRSGDLVRLRADGSFDYIGRKDRQVKLNGQRVELGEITGAILESGYVTQAAVVAVRKDDGSMELCAFCETDQQENIKNDVMTYLRKVLPVYMLPARLLGLQKMPMTATNKIDMQMLQKMAEEGTVPVLEEITEEKVDVVQENPGSVQQNPAPNGKITADYVLSVWNKVLSVPAQDQESSFFEMGGTSMGALNVLSHYFNDHLEMSLSEFYENPTAEGQAVLLNRCVFSVECAEEILESDAAVQDTKKTKERAKQCEEMKIDWSLNKKPANKKRKDKAILVTGGTGFFGSHLIKALLAENRQVVCLMRDGDEQRLHECLAWYFGQGILESAEENLKVVKGDISKEHLGMSERDYIMLTTRIGEVYHCAADVRHYAADEESYLAINVEGTAHMLAFARLSGASFYHMSTCSVSGEHLKEDSDVTIFTEEDYDIGQIWEENIYVKSKFLAEGLVLQAAAEGLNAKIFRLGRLVGRASDGVFQKNPGSNVFYLLVKGFCQLGAIPAKAACEEVDLMPVDVCVEEVLALKDSDGLIYHIMNHCPPVLETVVRALNKQIRVEEEEAFAALLEKKAPELDKELAALLMDHWHRSKVKPPVIRISAKVTEQHLAEAGYYQKIPAPEQVLKGFYMQESK